MEKVDEKFSLKKFFSAPANPLYYAKVASLWGGPVLLLLIGYTCYRAYFKRIDTNKVIAQEGSIVNIVGDRKKTFIPFVEGFVEKNANTDQEFNTGIRAGLRFEW